jgi:hypothetical protein
MKVYVDCDIAVKFAQWGLLHRLTQHLVKQGKAELYTVQTLRYRFKLATPDKAAAMLGSKKAVEQLSGFVQACKPPLGFSKTVLAALADVPSVDVGEATLFAAAGNYDAALVDTGDKNALRALGKLPATNEARTALHGKLACLEQTLEYFIGRWGFEIVRSAVTANTSADGSATACFKHGAEKDATTALKQQIASLGADCPLLSGTPFAWVPSSVVSGG